MKLIFKILTLAILTSNAFGQESEKLYPIMKENLYGYIDNMGKVIIKPQFLSAGEFSEGLAPVRLKGTYGYINEKGKFTIPPKYDFALSFYKGLAKVYIDGNPYYIDKKGKNIFNQTYKSISDFNNNSFAIVLTQSNKFGVVNKTGKLVIDTIYSRISSFTNGVAIVTGSNHQPSSYDGTKKVIYEKGVIDTLGNWKVRFGEYKDIEEFYNGFAHVELNVERQKGYYDHKGVIDETGKYKFTVPSKKWKFDFRNDNFYQDIAIVEIYSVNPDSIKDWSSSKRYDFKGAINTNGEIILSNTDWDEITPFAFNRAFAKSTSGKWFLINTKGQTVIPQPFDNILYDTYKAQPEFLFQNGRAFVETEKGWGAIDTAGRFVVEPKDVKNIEHDSLIRRGNIIFLEEDISDKSDKYSSRYGFWDTVNNTIVRPQFHYIDMDGFNNKLIYVMQDEKFGYINSKGQLIWQGENKTDKKQLNIDYMNRGYYYASSKYKKGLEGYGGWGSSDNSSKKINSNITFSQNILQILIDANQKTKWSEKYDAIKLFVANTSSDTLYFSAQDSRLDLKIQAQDRNGEWKDIEYLSSSWCGNSYHTLFLASNELWEFATPLYQGEFKTKMRAKLFYKKTKGQKTNDIIYSNEIECYINPGQFWNKKEYIPNGLMDPYND